MEGWIRIYRKIQNHWLWKQKRKFSQFEAWISLLFKANHKDTKIMFEGKVIEVKKGSFITSEIKLSDEWNWSRDTVRKFLKILQKEKMISKIATTKYTSISIENWELYQFSQQQNRQQNRQQSIQVVDNTLDTDNNDNNDNNNIYYLSLFNKYKEQISGKNFSEKIKAIGECKKEEQYSLLNLEQQDKLFMELMSLK